MVEMETESEVEAMTTAGAVVAEALRAVAGTADGARILAN